MSQFTSDEFLKSFLEEAGDYLQTILNCLLALEKSFSKNHLRRSKASRLTSPVFNDDLPDKIVELLRALHSLKGISGMIGLSQAAEVCHAMETVVKPIQHNLEEMSGEKINLLIDAAKILESVVHTVKDPSLAIPDTQTILHQLEGLGNTKAEEKPLAKEKSVVSSESLPQLLNSANPLPPEVSAHLGPAEWRKINSAFASGNKVAVVFYTPSKSSSEEGRNVNQVRGLLNQHTTLIKAIPLIKDSQVRFAFVVSCTVIPPSPELGFLDWQAIEQTDLTPVVEESFPANLISPTPASNKASPITIRVNLDRMDELMQLVGDLVVTRSRISETLPHLSGIAPDVLEGLEEASSKMERQVRHLREAVMRVRLVPLSEVFSRMPLAVRDLSRSTGKQVQLVLEGGDTEIDKALVERLFDPLMHMVRNAVTHGLEKPEERLAMGKPAEGVIRLGGKTEGDHIIITVEDDGGGIDVDKIRAKVRSLGWVEDDRPLNNQDILNIISKPGFSTEDNPSMGAGRGMGMNVAAEIIKGLGGNINLETIPQKGTRFIIQLPLTMTIIDAFIVEAGSQRYAVPQMMVNEVIEVLPDQITHLLNHDLLPYRNSAIPVISLHNAFHLPQSPGERSHGLVIGENDRKAVILVDRVAGLRETVVRPLSDPLIEEPAISGATELGDGSVVLILNCHELARKI